MGDRPLITKHPKVKPEDDHWMLDRWTADDQHVVMAMARDVKDVNTGRVTETIYRGVCMCGWRSVEVRHVDNIDADCPVQSALAQRARRKRGSDRIDWKVIT